MTHDREVQPSMQVVEYIPIQAIIYVHPMNHGLNVADVDSGGKLLYLEADNIIHVVRVRLGLFHFLLNKQQPGQSAFLHEYCAMFGPGTKRISPGLNPHVNELCPPLTRYKPTSIPLGYYACHFTASP